MKHTALHELISRIGNTQIKIITGMRRVGKSHLLNSFYEYHAAIGGNLEAAFQDYLLYGGMPEIFTCSTKNTKEEYLTRLSESFLCRLSKKARRKDVLTTIIEIICSGMPLTLEELTNKASQAVSGTVNLQLVKKYMGYLKDAFLFSECRQKLEMNFLSSSFIGYVGDTGLRSAFTGFRPPDSISLRNVLYNELIARGYDVYYTDEGFFVEALYRDYSLKIIPQQLTAESSILITDIAGAQTETSLTEFLAKQELLD